MSANEVRKNFVFKKEVAEHLEAIAKEKGNSMTAVVQEMIEERYKEIEKQKKIEAAKSIFGSAAGVFGDLTIQEIKGMMDV